MSIIVTITSEAALIKNPESEEAQLQNLMLNMMGGLQYCDLQDDEKALLKKHGYEE